MCQYERKAEVEQPWNHRNIAIGQIFQCPFKYVEDTNMSKI